jgi:hypothetical protein
MLSDTHPEAQAMQLELLRKATPAERFELVRSLTALVVTNARRAIARANPGASQEELDLIFVEVHYGAELAARLREFFKSRAS